MTRAWTDLLRSLGDSLVGLAGAEAAALKGDLRSSGRQLAIAVALMLAAVFLFFWVVGAVGFVLYHVLTIWLPRWGAAAIVCGIFLCLASGLVVLARQRLRAIEVPLDTVRRHVDDHMEWWRGEVLVQSGSDRQSLAGDADQDDVGASKS